jgi:hypothetical protein
MRITKTQLQDLVNEEIASALLKKQNKRLIEAVSSYRDAGHGGLYDSDVSELLDFAESYTSLGAAVQDQLRELLDSGEDAEVNSNAVQMIEDRLGGMNHEIDVAIEAWKEANGV